MPVVKIDAEHFPTWWFSNLDFKEGCMGDVGVLISFIYSFLFLLVIKTENVILTSI